MEHFTLSSETVSPPFSLIISFIAQTRSLSFVPIAIILWPSCATDAATAPFFKPNPLIKPAAAGASLYLSFTTILRMSSDGKLFRFLPLTGPCITSLVSSSPSNARITLKLRPLFFTIHSDSVIQAIVFRWIYCCASYDIIQIISPRDQPADQFIYVSFLKHFRMKVIAAQHYFSGI